jgi:hypothetical protein
MQFFFTQGTKGLIILSRLQNVYGDRAMKQTHAYFLIGKVRRAREDLSQEERQRKPPEVGIDEMLTHRIGTDPHAPEGKLAHSLGISLQMVVKH